MVPISRVQYDDLVKDISRHCVAYYLENSPIISDREFDALYAGLLAVEKEHPDWISPNSPSQKVGAGQLVEGMSPLTHAVPMLSLENTYSKDDMTAFLDRVQTGLKEKQPAYVVEPKIDGIAVKLVYLDGLLDSAATRGDGRVGEDITLHAKTIRSLPHKVEGAPARLEVDGEIFMPKVAFEAFNNRRIRDGLPPMSNPRNAAGGALKLNDAAEAAQRPLDIVLYRVDTPEPESQSKALDMIRNLGLPGQAWRRIAYSQEEVWAAISELDEAREDLPYPMDGAVVKLDNGADQREVGSTAKTPRWAFAYKYESEQAETRIRSVTFQVGRTGTITPVAELEPVMVSGSTISRATLHNFEDLRKKDICYGDIVMVEKAGEVIPSVASVVTTKRVPGARPICPPTHCPSCGSAVVVEGGFARCGNSRACDAQVKRRIEYFCEKRCMDISGIGESVVERLVDSGTVKTPADLYSLTVEQLRSVEAIGPKAATNLMKAIEDSKANPPWRLLHGLGISNVGNSLSKRLMKKFGSMEALIAATDEQLQAVEDVGDVVVEATHRYFSDPFSQTELERFKLAGVAVETAKLDEKSGAKPLHGLGFVLTGTLTKSREHFENLIEQAGGVVLSSVTKKTSYLLVGQNAGSKLDKARTLGIPVIDETVFVQMIAVKTESEHQEIPSASVAPQQAERSGCIAASFTPPLVNKTERLPKPDNASPHPSPIVQMDLF